MPANLASYYERSSPPSERTEPPENPSSTIRCGQGSFPASFATGKVPERPKGHASKACEVQASVGSNPTLSANALVSVLCCSLAKGDQGSELGKRQSGVNDRSPLQLGRCVTGCVTWLCERVEPAYGRFEMPRKPTTKTMTLVDGSPPSLVETRPWLWDKNRSEAKADSAPTQRWLSLRNGGSTTKRAIGSAHHR